MPAAIDFSGQRFGSLVALRRAPPRGSQTFWAFRCDCGAEKEIDLNNVRRGTVQSCGCQQRGLPRNGRRSHGLSGTAEHQIWISMRQRCTNPAEPAYPDYGGRGIYVCDRWTYGDGERGGFECFLADMGAKPAPGLSLERRDNDGPYSPENCVWATPAEQARNRRTNRHLTIDGERLIVADVARRVGLTPACLARRLSAGWSVERALQQPPMPPRRRRRQSADASATRGSPRLCSSPPKPPWRAPSAGRIREPSPRFGSLAP